ncbi:MAG: methyl-accepting chemotaxis protein [Leptospiraceae bacterium]|nr:methyl-accepting chemotaxis protein [Leptospiraceae bacterium]MCP5493286.1 methyl-accepting chemotaxis protein [Leptospiraceae bacterium]
MRKLFLNKFVSNITIKLKLLLLLAIPMIGVLLFSGSIVWERYGTYKEIIYLNKLVDFVVHSSALVHELQKERGLSAGFLGSQGQSFRENLQEQRKLTDDKIKSLKELFSGQSINNEKIDSLGRTYLWSTLQELYRIRKEVDALTIKVKPQITFYTSLNSIIINIIAQVSKLSNHSELTSSLFSYISFIQSKENSGIERAVLNNTFAQGQFEEDMYVMFISLIARQEAFQSSFMNATSEDIKQKYKDTMKKDIVEEVERMRLIALSGKKEELLGVRASDWYKTMTEKINLLYKVENEIVKEILGKAKKLKELSYYELIFSIIIVSLILFLILFVSLVIHRNISLRIENMLVKMDRIVMGDLTVQVESIGKDEISMLEVKLNDLVKSLSSIIGELKYATEKLHNSSNDLRKSSDILSNEMDTASNESLSITSSAEDMNFSLESVSASVEEMSITIHEIAKRASEGSNSSRIANDRVLSMHKSINELGEHARNISSVIDSIVAIAAQTNLLALNASIEAASAGEAGKGFGVVAGEVKELSFRASNSSRSIKENIGIVQQEVVNNIQSVELVVDAIQSSNKISLSIASAVEEQSIAMKEIAEMIAKVSSSSRKVAKNIAEIATLVKNGAENADKTNQQTLVLDELSSNLQNIVNKFQINR